MGEIAVLFVCIFVSLCIHVFIAKYNPANTDCFGSKYKGAIEYLGMCLHLAGFLKAVTAQPCMVQSSEL